MPLQIIVTDTEHELEPFDWQDDVAIAAAGLCTLVLCGGWCLVAWRLGQYPPLRSRTLSLSAAMSLFSLVHVWTTATSNNVLVLYGGGAATLGKVGCTLLNYWAQYFVGLDGWITCLLLRMVVHGAVFHPRLRVLSMRSVRRFSYLVVVCTILPLLVLCLLIQLEPGVVYQTEGSCHTQTAYKAVLAIWVALACAAVLFCNRYLRPKDRDTALKASFFSEYAALRDIGEIGVLTIIVNGFIAVAGLSNYAWGRGIFTTLVALLHTFAFLRLYGYRLFQALRRDEAYVRDFLSTSSVYGQQLAGVRDLLSLPSVLDNFVDFCQQNPTDGAGPHVLELFHHLTAWREAGSGQGVRTLDMFARLLRTYLASHAPQSVNLPASLQSRISERSNYLSPTREADPSLFDEVYDWLLVEIDRRWSGAFFNSLLSERMLAMASEVELRTLQMHKTKQLSDKRRQSMPLLKDAESSSHGASLVSFNGSVDLLRDIEFDRVRLSIDARPSIDVRGGRPSQDMSQL